MDEPAKSWFSARKGNHAGTVNNHHLQIYMQRTTFSYLIMEEAKLLRLEFLRARENGEPGSISHEK